MIRLTETEDFVVYDDVLEKDQLEAVWNAVQAEQYCTPHIGGWSKVWRLTDGSSIGGTEYDSSASPFNNYMDVMKFVIEGAALLNPKLVSGWTHISLRSYLYARGTKLSWHNDFGYLGAAIFYAHPYWASTWGGELMVAKTPPDASFSAPHLDHKDEDRLLEKFGLGTYITAKPNRLVLTRPGVWHQINRVDADAGDHVRASVVGFFKS